MFPIGNMNIQSPEQLGVAIRARRKQLRVTQKDLAMTCGTGLRFIIDLEKGKSTCQIGKILQVLQALGLKLRIASPGADSAQGEKS
jgi:y4mF family transcriptional regulator